MAVCSALDILINCVWTMYVCLQMQKKQLYGITKAYLVAGCVNLVVIFLKYGDGSQVLHVFFSMACFCHLEL